MKTHVMLTLFLWCTATVTYSQVGMTANNPNKDAVLDLNNADGTNTKGLLLPKVALTSTTSFAPLTAHVAGMKVYNTFTSAAGVNQVTPGEYYNDGSKWIRLETTEGWSMYGNSGTNTTTNSLGTKDTKAFVMATNGEEKMRITSAGQTLIGTTTGGGSGKLVLNSATPGAIQIKDGSEGEGKVLVSDADGVGTWTELTSTGKIYNSTIAQNFASNVSTVIQTSEPIVVPENGNYLVTLRWRCITPGTWSASGLMNRIEFTLYKTPSVSSYEDMAECDFTIPSGSTNAKISGNVNFIVQASAGEVLTIAAANRLSGGTLTTGSEGLTKSKMPSIILSKL